MAEKSLKELAAELGQAIKGAEDEMARYKEEKNRDKKAEVLAAQRREEAFETIFTQAKDALSEAFLEITKLLPPSTGLRVSDSRDTIRERERHRRDRAHKSVEIQNEPQVLRDGRVVEHFVSLLIPVRRPGSSAIWSIVFGREVKNNNDIKRMAMTPPPTVYGDEVVAYLHKTSGQHADPPRWIDPVEALEDDSWARTQVETMIARVIKDYPKESPST